MEGYGYSLEHFSAEAKSGVGGYGYVYFLAQRKVTVTVTFWLSGRLRLRLYCARSAKILGTVTVINTILGAVTVIIRCGYGYELGYGYGYYKVG